MTTTKGAHVFTRTDGLIGVFTEKPGKCRMCGTLHHDFTSYHGETLCSGCADTLLKGEPFHDARIS